MTMENEAHTILVVEDDEALLLLLLDYRLPDMTCKQVVETLAEQQRSIPFIYAKSKLWEGATFVDDVPVVSDGQQG